MSTGNVWVFSLNNNKRTNQIDTETNNWFNTNQLVCHCVFSCTQEQKDRNICRLQGLFFPACSVQPLQWAVTQPETARCRPATNAARTKHVRTVIREKNPTWKKSESSPPATLSCSPCCLFNPSLPGVTERFLDYLRGGGVTVPQAGSINTRPWLKPWWSIPVRLYHDAILWSTSVQFVPSHQCLTSYW